MFSDDGLVTKSLEDLQNEIDSLREEAAKLRIDHDAAIQKIEDLRRQAVETRPLNPEEAELVWQEAERLQDESKEMLRQSVEKTLKAGEIKRRLDIRAQIEAIDDLSEIWQQAARARRS